MSPWFKPWIHISFYFIGCGCLNLYLLLFYLSLLHCVFTKNEKFPFFRRCAFGFEKNESDWPRFTSPSNSWSRQSYISQVICTKLIITSILIKYPIIRFLYIVTSMQMALIWLNVYGCQAVLLKLWKNKNPLKQAKSHINVNEAPHIVRIANITKQLWILYQIAKSF